MIDIHTHVMTVWGGERPFTAERLLKRIDQLRIDRFVLLPIIGPEGNYLPFDSEDVIEVYRHHRKKVIPFCNIDPRAGSNSPTTDFSFLINRYKKAGCRGMGESMANIYFDSPLCINLFRQCGKSGLPVLFHMADKIGGRYGLVDSIHLPRLEKALKECPETIFIGHAMAFWSEISADVSNKTRGGYPKGPVKHPGRLVQLLKKYPNLYGDLSAGSGYNAITRDRKYGYRFLQEFQDKLLFGTDLCHVVQEVPIVDYFEEILKKGIISAEAHRKITHTNAERILNL